MAASSSRRSVVKAALFAVAAASLGGLAWLEIRPAAPSPKTLRLGILQGDRALGACPSDASERRRQHRIALWLTFASLPPEGRSRLLDLAESLSDSFEAKRHPFAMDLSDESPEEALRREAPWLLPVWTAARALAQRCFVSGDRKLAVLVPDDGTTLPEGVASFEPLSEPSDDPSVKLARFISWPVSSAHKLSAPGATPAKSLWNTLRKESYGKNSPIALVIDGATQAVRPGELFAKEHVARLRDLKKRLAKAPEPKCKNCSIFTELMVALADGPPPAPALPWLALESREALIIPRLSAVAQPERFERQLARVLADAAGPR